MLGIVGLTWAGVCTLHYQFSCLWSAVSAARTCMEVQERSYQQSLQLLMPTVHIDSYALDLALSIFFAFFSSLSCVHTKGQQVEQSRLRAAGHMWIDNAKIGEEKLM